MNQGIPLDQGAIDRKEQFDPRAAIMQPSGRHTTVTAIIAAATNNEHYFPARFAK